jgi:hypothetical protein
MRTLTSNVVNQKVEALSREAKSHLSSIIAFFEGNSKDRVSQSSSSPVVMKLVGEIFVARILETQVYFSFGSDSNGEYLLILDVTEARKHPIAPNFFAVKNPRVNSLLNPQFNAQINPQFNAQINPQFNAQINPQFNAQINPQFNAQINPQFNAQINPQFNAQINPQFNAQINPQFNAQINPRFNSAYGGPFLYSLSLDQEGFLVRANDEVSIIFDKAGGYSGFTVQHDKGIVLTFDINNRWTGYFVPSGQDPLIRFDISGKWIGIVV